MRPLAYGELVAPVREPWRRVRFCTAGDFIIHKAVAGRGIDLADIQGVITRQRDRLDARYIRRWLREFSAVLESPEVLECFKAPLRHPKNT